VLGGRYVCIIIYHPSFIYAQLLRLTLTGLFDERNSLKQEGAWRLSRGRNNLINSGIFISVLQGDFFSILISPKHPRPRPLSHHKQGLAREFLNSFRNPNFEVARDPWSDLKNAAAHNSKQVKGALIPEEK
jgi:hypothetical protein